MRKNAIVSRYQSIVDAADRYNGRSKTKRFYPMCNHRGHYITEVGLYDYQTKKYILRDTSSHDLEKAFKYMEDKIANAGS